MALESVSAKPVISKRISRTMPIFGAVFTIIIFLTTLVPRDIPVNRLGVSLLLFLALLSFIILYFLPAEFRSGYFLFFYGVLSVMWVSALILFTGGSKSDFFPVFYLILVFGGLYLEKQWEVAAFLPYYLTRETRRVREEKTEVEKLATDLDIRAKQMEVLFFISNKVGRVLRVRYVLEMVVSSVAVAINADYAVIHLLDDEGSRLELAASHGLSKSQPAFSRG